MPTDNKPFNILENLPEELTVEILDKLNPRELATASQASKKINRLSKEDSLWQQRYQTYFGKKLPPGFNKYNHEAFRQRALQVRAFIFDNHELRTNEKAFLQQYLFSGHTDCLPNLDMLLTALNMFSQAGFLLGVEQLLQREEIKKNATAYSVWMLGWASRNGHIDVINRLLEIDDFNRNAAEWDNWALRWAAKHGHLDVVCRLLENEKVRKDAAAWENLSLRWAAEDGHFSIVNRLLDILSVRADATAWDNLTLRMADKYNHIETVDRLLKISMVRQFVLKEPSRYSDYIVQKVETIQATLSPTTSITPSFERVRDEDNRPNDENTENNQSTSYRRFSPMS